MKHQVNSNRRVSTSTGLIQVTALNIPRSQHEAYLGFISGVLFGIAGGALVLLLQEMLEPLWPRTRQGAAEPGNSTRGTPASTRPGSLQA
jgi:hypothetical protein